MVSKISNVHLGYAMPEGFHLVVTHQDGRKAALTKEQSEAVQSMLVKAANARKRVKNLDSLVIDALTKAGMPIAWPTQET